MWKILKISSHFQLKKKCLNEKIQGEITADFLPQSAITEDFIPNVISGVSDSLVSYNTVKGINLAVLIGKESNSINSQITSIFYNDLSQEADLYNQYQKNFK